MTHNKPNSFMKSLFEFDGIHDKPMMNTLKKLQSMGYIDLKWLEGDVRLCGRSDNDPIIMGPYYCQNHLGISIIERDIELYFPSYVPGMVMDSQNNAIFSPVKWEWGNNCPCALASSSQDWIEYMDGEWSNVCLECLQEGIWGEVFYETESRFEPGFGVNVCIVGCHKCVKNRNYTWGHIKINDIMIYPQCNSSETQIVINESDEIHERTNISIICDIIYDIWNYHPDYDPPQWHEFFTESPERLNKLICETLQFYDGPEKHMNEYMQHGQPHEIWTYSENYRGHVIPYEREEYNYEMNTLDIIQSETNEEYKEKCNEGLKIIEGIMDDNGKMNQGKFLDLCNIFRDIYQS
tara:strand:+ start:1102 stop:2154 length:1053 start_codon:yes stop_codon:yes gene_type:complete